MSDRAGATGGSALPGILAIFVLSRLVLVIVALLVEANIPMQPGGSASTAPILRSLTSSDGPWYLSIAASGYHAEALRGAFHDYVFFPLWPLVIRIASVFSGGNLAVAAVVTANAAFGLALVVFDRLSRPILGASGTLTAAAFLAFAPGAVAFAMAYTDSLFLLLSLSTVVAAQRGSYPLMSVLFALAALTRLPGIVLMVPLGVILVERHGWRLHRTWVWLASGPIALAGFFGFIIWLTGDVLADSRAQAVWNNPPDTTAPPGVPAIPTALIVVALIAVAAFYLFQLVYLRRSGIPRADAAYAITGLIALGLTARIVSLPRYLAVLWPFPWLFTARRSDLFRGAALAATAIAFVVFAFLNFTTLVAA